MHRRSLCVLVAGALIGAGAILGTSPAGATSSAVVVNPSNFNLAGGWFASNDGQPGVSSETLVNGPATPPLGFGSLQLKTDASSAAMVQNVDPAYAGTPFSQITKLGYSSARQSPDATNTLAPYLELNVDYDLSDASTVWQGRLNFEPYQTVGSGNVPSGWSTWDALAGRWWGTGTPVVGNASAPQACPQSSPCTWAQVLAAYPNAGIHTGVDNGITLRVGGFGAAFTGTVDGLTVGVNGNDKTWDFEPATSATTVIVGPKNVNASGASWVTYNDLNAGVGSAAFVPGPATPPIGVGSLQLSADAAAAEVVQNVDPAYAGTPLSQLTALEYSSDRTTANPANVVAPYLQLNVDYDLTDASSAWQGRLSFQPYTAVGAGSVTPGWHTWNAFSGLWWSTGTPIVGNAAAPVACPQSSPCTWAQVLAAYPNAGIHTGIDSGILLRMGQESTQVQTAAVDGLTIGVNGNARTYDFEPYADLAVSLGAPAKVRHNHSLTYTVTVKNNGPATAQNLVMLLAVPSGVTVTNAGGGTPFLGLLAWSQPSLASGQTVTHTVTGTVTAAKGTQLTALDAGSSRTPDPGAGNPFNDLASAVTKVT